MALHDANPDPIEEGDPSLTSLDGLAKMWEDTEILRDRLLGTGSLLTWPEKKLTGVITFHTLSYNARLIERVLQLWCPQVETPKTVVIEQVREQVGISGERH